jgi:hypothetical protein
MLSNEENFKDTSGTSVQLSLKDKYHSISYSKLDRLVTALYMVTDIIEKEEPLREKLRTLATGIISDISFSLPNAVIKIIEIKTFLTIASTMKIISEMNANILLREFEELERSIKESKAYPRFRSNSLDLSEFFLEEIAPSQNSVIQNSIPPKNDFRENSISAQKSNTMTPGMSDRTNKVSLKNLSDSRQHAISKGQRQGEIKNIIKIIGKGATIKDIMEKAKALPELAPSLESCSEKTLQRELLDMLRNNVLKKTGEKRWSRYFTT